MSAQRQKPIAFAAEGLHLAFCQSQLGNPGSKGRVAARVDQNKIDGCCGLLAYQKGAKRAWNKEKIKSSKQRNYGSWRSL